MNRRHAPARNRQGQARFAALLVLLAALVMAPASVMAARVALVVGNADYQQSPLVNPTNDAKAVAAKLRALDFKVTEVLNLKRDEIGITIEKFLSQIGRGDSALFFYAGHGVQVDGRNYLLAVDASLQSQYDVPLNAIDVTTLLGRLENTGADVKLMFLDACRDNPFLNRFRGGGNRGLARMGNAPNGTLISFATRPGGVAADGDGSNGLYTSHLLRFIDQPGLPVEQMLKKVAAATIKASEGKQSPWIEGSITGEFLFNAVAAPQPVAPVPAAVARPSGPTEAERVAWEIASNNDSALGYELFLQEYPASTYAPVARMKIALQRALANRELAAAGPGTAARSQAQPAAATSGPAATAANAPVPAASPAPQASLQPSVEGGKVYQPAQQSQWEVTLTRTTESIFVDRLVYLGEISTGGGFDPQPPHEFICPVFGIALRRDGMIEPTTCSGDSGDARLHGRVDRLKIDLSNGAGYRERFAVPLIHLRGAPATS